MRAAFTILAAVLMTTSCGEQVGGGSEAADASDGILVSPDAGDLRTIEVSPSDADAGEEDGYTGPCSTNECCQVQYWYCPESFLGDELWRIEVIVDICDDEGVPCQPVFGDPDDSCEWEVVSQGECELVFDCNPHGDIDLGTQVCEVENPDGTTTFGEQQVWCNKGQLQYGDCIACEDEVCDGVDNDCDGIIDEGEYPCETECGPGTAICIDGEIVLCDAPTSTPEVCNALDDDCDGDIDEDLVNACETECELGVEWCVDGEWGSCTAAQPLDEVCNGFDDDCDGLVDEGLDCACPPEMVGFLMPCMEDPLICGQGFKTCECADEECSATQMTECLAMCHWLPPDPLEVCDPFLGIILDEVCNDFDDNCNALIDEDLLAACYTGPGGTAGVGVCHAGGMVCEAGQWGNQIGGVGPFVPEFCADEQTPLEEDLCSGQDDNCDGEIEKVLEETDILFIVDTSGSMSSTINAVQQAMSMFAAHYADQEVVQWGLVIGPVSPGETLSMATNLVPFDQFLPLLAAVGDEDTGSEMLYDALLLSIRNLVPPGALPELPPMAWSGVSSVPSIGLWEVNWREDAHHVVVVYSDEPGQSFMNPAITQALIVEWEGAADDLAVYTFSKNFHQNGPFGWEPVAVGGGWFELTSNPAAMFDDLMQVIDETACGGGE
jgi:hypothetical protein